MQSYRTACDLRDFPSSQAELDFAVQLFAALNTFDGFYAAGEMYKYRIPKEFNGVSMQIGKNDELATEFFLKAYEAFENTDKTSEVKDEKSDTLCPQFKLKVQVGDAVVESEKTPADFKQANLLLEKANSGHPEYLFQLACFLIQELERFEKDSERRIFVISKQKLVLWIKRCLEAAASSYHPHAAYLLVKQYANHPLLDKEKEHLSVAKKLEYSFTAADPSHAIRCTSYTTMLFLRGPGPVTNPVYLFGPSGKQEALFQTETISQARMGGIFAHSVVNRRGSVLPEVFTEFKAVAKEAVLSPAEMRQKRLDALTKKGIPQIAPPPPIESKLKR